VVILQLFKCFDTTCRPLRTDKCLARRITSVEVESCGFVARTGCVKVAGLAHFRSYGLPHRKCGAFTTMGVNRLWSQRRDSPCSPGICGGQWFEFPTMFALVVVRSDIKSACLRIHHSFLHLSGLAVINIGI